MYLFFFQDRSKRSSGADDEYEYSGAQPRGGILPSPRRPSTPAGSETSRPGSGTGPPGGVARIRVVVRKRPINKKELARREEDVVWIDEAGTALQVSGWKTAGLKVGSYVLCVLEL